MVKHLEPDYFLSQRPTGYLAHFWETIESLGGYIGLGLITFGIILFYFLVNYIIYRSRQAREAKKKR